MNMHRSLALMALFTAPLLCAAETWNDVSMVDANCSAKVKDNPDAHTRNCAIQCAKSGFGILTADGTYLKFQQLKETTRFNHSHQFGQHDRPIGLT